MPKKPTLLQVGLEMIDGLRNADIIDKKEHSKVTSFSIKAARIHLTDLVDRAYMLKEETIITKSGKPRAKIVGLTEKEIKDIIDNTAEQAA